MTTMNSSTWRRRAHLGGLALAAWSAAGVAAAQVSNLAGGPAVNQVNLGPPATRIAGDIQWLHNMMLVICLVIFVAVFGVMFYSILKHRKSLGAKSANFHESVVVEVAWTVVPLLIVIAMGAMATRTVVAMKDTSNADLTIKATGYQWKWGYDYLRGEGEGIGFLSTLDPAQRVMSDEGKPQGDDYLLRVDNPLVVPVNKKVRIITTANDVIHAWMVPAFGVKQDAIPGFVRDTWFRAEEPGVYRGQCAELCGKEHGFMPIVVRVVSDDDYAKWVTEHKSKVAAAAPTATDAAPAVAATATAAAAAPAAAAGPANGKATYEQVCQMCHAAGIAGAPKVGDKAAWAPRIKQGDKTLYAHAIGGIRMMPAKGGNPSLSDAQVEAAVNYMVSASK